MSENSRLSSKFLFCLITISMFLLILSSMSLIQFGNTSSMPRSVFNQILMNTSSIYLRHNVNAESFKLSFFSSIMSPQSDVESATKPEEVTCSSSKIGIHGDPVAKTCNRNQSMLRVYMYDLPPEFHFGLLGWKGETNQTWPNVSDHHHIPPYPGGLNLQHSVEYWLTLDLLASNTLDVVRPCSAVRVENSSEANVIFVPFFASLSYNQQSKIRGKETVSVNKMLQSKLVRFLLDQREWKRFEGKDHLIIAHHPNSMLYARKKLGSAIFVLADFGRYRVQIANIGKDIIAPYKHVVRTVPIDESARFHQRPILAYFQGAIYRKDGGVIRQELYYLLKDEKDVHFTFGTVRGNGINRAGKGMASSKFCLNIAGDTPSSNRLFDAIVTHCVPVIISDNIELPFEDVLDYSEFCVFVRASDAVKKGYLLSLLRGIKQETWTKMWEKLKSVTQHFEYKYPSRHGDAVDMIWEAVSRKTSSLQLKRHRKDRFNRSNASRKSH